MGLTYDDVMKADLSSLLEASNMWKKMGERFGELRTNYDTHVRSLTGDGGAWTGAGARTFTEASKKTLHEFDGAKKQARAVASLLDDAHSQLTSLKKKVEQVRDAAIAAGMRVDDYGTCNLDFSGYTAAEKQAIAHDPGLADTENKWTQKIRDAVQAVSDADAGVRLALQTVSKDQDGKGALHGFNSEAMGDVEKYEAQRAADLGTKLNSGEDLTGREIAEFQRLARDNADDKTYSRTLLNTLGADGTIKMTNALNEKARVTDKDQGKGYLAIQRGLAQSLATATKDTNSEFYREWRKDMRKAGVEEFDGPLGPNAPVKGANQEVRGYQSLLTLMQSGDPESYSPQFLKDLGNDIYHAEKETQGNIWDVNQAYGGKMDEWFANDPLDSTLGIMSHHPDAATDFLDPGPDGNNEKLDYLINDRDWEGIEPITRWDGNVSSGTNVWPAEEDSDAREGFGAALEAATTGHEPLQEGQSGGVPGSHTSEQARVMQETITSLDMGSDGHGSEARHGEDIPQAIRKNLAHALADYVPDTYAILSEKDGYYDSPGGGGVWSDDSGNSGINVNQGSLVRVMRGISEDDQSYALLYDSNRLYAAEQLGSAPQEIPRGDETWKNTSHDAGEAIGALNTIGADVIYDERNDEKAWAADVQRYSYHGAGSAVTGIPVVGDVAQRSIDAVGYEWQKDVMAAADAEAQARGSENYSAGLTGTYGLLEHFATERNIPITEEDDANYQNNSQYDEYQAMRREAKNGYIVGRAGTASHLGWN